MPAALSLMALIATCAPMVAPETMAAVIRVESGANPNAIGVVRGKLARQPRNKAEAISTVQALEKGRWNYSVGLAQVNKAHFKRYGMSESDYFEPCRNINVGGQILHACYQSSLTQARNIKDRNYHLRRAFSCYYTGRLESPEGSRYADQILGGQS